MIEIVTVMGIFAVLAAATLILGFDGLRGYTFRTDRDNLIAALHRARAEALGNVCLSAPSVSCSDGRPHGVYIEPGRYTIFQGESYDTRDEEVDEFLDANSTIVQSGTVTEVVFTQLSGSVATPGTIVLADQAGRSSTITIEEEGRIWWTN